MLVQAALAVAVLLLVAAGGYQLWTGRLSDTDTGSDQLLAGEEEGLLTREDLRNPGRIAGNGAKLRNLVMILSEVAVMVLAAMLVVFMYTRPADAVGVEFKALLTLCFGVGAYLIGRALYVRLGLARTGESEGSTTS